MMLCLKTQSPTISGAKMNFRSTGMMHVDVSKSGQRKMVLASLLAEDDLSSEVCVTYCKFTLEEIMSESGTETIQSTLGRFCV